MNSIFHKSILLLAVGLSLLTTGANAADAPAARSPNIIFILADDLGYGDLGCYGQKMIQTPNLDQFAAQGLRFTDAYSGATVCAPSRCSLMTGLHGGHAHVRGNKLIPLRPQDLTVAELLKNAGYATALVGKWGIGEPDTTGFPTKKGFGFFFGYVNQVHAHNSFPEYLWKNNEKIQLDNKLPQPNKTRFGEGVSEKKADFSNDLFSQNATAFVTQNKDRPFFLYLAYTVPHANNEAGKAGIEVPSDAPYSDKPWPANEKNFAAMITRMDTQIGKLLALLKDLKIDENTIVFFTSDNGPHKEGGHDPEFFNSRGPLKGIKRDLYEGGIRVPFMVRWPGKIQPGTSDFVTAFWDFLPTAADLAGASGKVPTGLDGISILPTLLGKAQKPHEYLYFEFHERGFDQAIRMENWKAVKHGTKSPIELYDLKKDLGETTDVAGQNPQIIEKLTPLFTSARTDHPDFPITEKPKRNAGKTQPNAPR